MTKKVVLKVNATGRGTIHIDDKEIENVRGVKVQSSVDDLTTVTIELVNVDVEAELEAGIVDVTPMNNNGYREYRYAKGRVTTNVSEPELDAEVKSAPGWENSILANYKAAGMRSFDDKHNCRNCKCYDVDGDDVTTRGVMRRCYHSHTVPHWKYVCQGACLAYVPKQAGRICKNYHRTSTAHLFYKGCDNCQNYVNKDPSCAACKHSRLARDQSYYGRNGIMVCVRRKDKHAQVLPQAECEHYEAKK